MQLAWWCYWTLHIPSVARWILYSKVEDISRDTTSRKTRDIIILRTAFILNLFTKLSSLCTNYIIHFLLKRNFCSQNIDSDIAIEMRIGSWFNNYLMSTTLYNLPPAWKNIVRTLPNCPVEKAVLIYRFFLMRGNYLSKLQRSNAGILTNSK